MGGGGKKVEGMFGGGERFFRVRWGKSESLTW